MDQVALRKFWLDAQEGRLCPWEQSKALALRQVGKEQNGGKLPKLDWIAERVTKVGGAIMSPGRSPARKRFAASSVCPACGEELPCTCRSDDALPELPVF